MPLFGVAQAATETVDEIHYSYGEAADTVVFDWHGAEQSIYYGLDATYGSQAIATPSAVTPVDTTGVFEEVKLTGLQPNTSYHYKIGVDGVDHVFSTAPTGSFTWADVGDTGSSVCYPWVTQTHALIAAQNPNFVTHGGDIAYANECGAAATHSYYVDQEAWSRSAAFQPVWGNHEYASPNSASLPGAVRDSLLNYKGRSYVTNGQTVPNDGAGQITAPGCGWETGSTINRCRGEDWGWFVAGHVLFISYPEPWLNALADWRTQATALMNNAQSDPNIDFVVTYGHRPAYTSLVGGENTDLRNAVNALAQQFSPSATNPAGKYVLNVAHHIHGEEAFRPINNLVNVVNGGGGAGETTFSTTPDPNSIFRTVHPGILSATYDAGTHTLAVRLLCGPVYTPKPNVQPCTYGSVLYSASFVHDANPAPRPVISTHIDDGTTSLQPGQQTTYTVTVANTQTGTSATGVAATATVPSDATVLDASGGAVNGNTVTWTDGTLDGGQPATTHQLTVQAGTTSPSLSVTAQVSTSDASCSTVGSTCSASDIDTVAIPNRQLIANQSVETDLTGWAGKYGPSPFVTVTRDTTTSHTGAASIKVTGLTGALNLQSGFNDNPRWVTSTVAGTVYTQSAWVKPTFTGQRITMRLREWNGATLVTDRFVTILASSTGWQQLTQTLAASRSGDQLAFAVSAVISANQSFNADDFSLTSPS